MKSPNDKTQRWTEVESKFGAKNKRIFDEVPVARITQADLQPLYSSFAPNGQLASALDHL